MFAGQMACEALNWVLKRHFKEERPRGKQRLGSMHCRRRADKARNARQGLRYAFVTRPVCGFLLGYPDAVPAVSSRSSPDRNTHAVQFRRPLRALTACPSICCSRRRQPHISQLPHSEASIRWLRLRCSVRPCVVCIHHISASSWLDRLGTRDMALQSVPSSGLSHSRGFGRLGLGQMGGQAQTTGLPLPGQEDQVRRRHQ
jgi:hypothetical protein